MGSLICMNISCGSSTSHDAKKGWPLRSGGFAHLCFNCGSAFENSAFCDKFHLDETGWRECHFCKKHVHCGCIASKALFEHLDIGGISCKNCLKVSQLHLADSSFKMRYKELMIDRLPFFILDLRNAIEDMIQNAKIPNGFGMLTSNHTSESELTQVDKRLFMDNGDEEKLMQLCRVMEANESNLRFQPLRDEMNGSCGKINQEVMAQFGTQGTGLSNVTETSAQPLTFNKLDNGKPPLENKDFLELPAPPSLSMSLGGLSGSTLLPFTGGVVEGKDQVKSSTLFSPGQKVRPILPKPSKTSETNKASNSQMRIARPPAEGRGKNQLLPRYWPRITDQELEQLAGDLNSTVVPLFEKQLSASDAGRIGRLVLPKACAEAYFPHINQSDGVPLRMQDVKGNEWTFQFRFWPNNNSRMYVLEGVTPCIQSMKLKAGDTVIFSQIDPGGKLVIGFRKASILEDAQDASASAVSNSTSSKENICIGANENHPWGSHSDDILAVKGSKDAHSNASSEHVHLADWDESDNHKGMTNNGPLKQLVTGSEKKRTKNIGPKNKRLHMHSEDAQDLTITWEEAQDLLRPPPSAKPSIVTIEDHVFEEYDVAPILAKRTVFSVRPTGGREQWAQCDECHKWRRLPEDVLVPLKWTCSENIWSASRSVCSAPEELAPKELDNFKRTSKELKRRRTSESNKPGGVHEATGLDALASAAVMGENAGEPSAGATTRHPRHRPGCTCIVCIQPPSGKGKHKPNCTCNVCLTVKRRFRTLMLRKKKRQSEREAEAAQESRNQNERDEGETKVNTARKSSSQAPESLKKETRNRNPPGVMMEAGAGGQIDLNCDPSREENHQVGDSTKQNGTNSILSFRRDKMDSSLLQRCTGEGQRNVTDVPVIWSHVNSGGDVHEANGSNGA